MEPNVKPKEMSLQLKTLYAAILSLMLVGLVFAAEAQDVSPILSWDFSEIHDSTTIEQQSGISDTLEGYVKTAPGISGSGLRLDGFTSCLKHKSLLRPGLLLGITHGTGAPFSLQKAMKPRAIVS